MPLIVRLKVNGVRKLLNSPGVSHDIAARGNIIAKTAGDGYAAMPVTHGTRAHCSVIAQSAAARVNEMTNGSLLHSIDAGRSL